MVGPPVGGFIVTYYSWRWIFFINVPIGIVGVVLVNLFIQDMREADVPPLDFLGFLLSGLGLAGLVFGFESIGRGIIPPARRRSTPMRRCTFVSFSIGFTLSAIPIRLSISP